MAGSDEFGTASGNGQEPTVFEGALVIGAGPAGLAAATALGRLGVAARVVERADDVGSSWRGYYDSLRLNSPRRLSSLPGAVIDRGCGRWPTRDDVIVYLERYARKMRLDIEFGVDVERLDRSGSVWRATTSAGPILARHVVVATGMNQRAVLPDWPGRDDFGGELLHGTDYVNAKPYAGKDVLVVGSGMTGTDITLELLAVGASRVRMSMRTPPIIFRPQILGVPSSALGYMLKRLPSAIHPLLDSSTLIFHRILYGDLSQHGLPFPPEGLISAMAKRHHGVTTDRGFVAAVKAGEIEIVAAVEGFDGGDVLLRGGGRASPDVVIAATGQSPVLQPLVGHLGVLTDDGLPRVHGGRTDPDAPDLHFIGFRLPPGQLPDLTVDAGALARRIALRQRDGARGTVVGRAAVVARAVSAAVTRRPAVAGPARASAAAAGLGNGRVAVDGATDGGPASGQVHRTTEGRV